jgi:methionyl aminopeptidase
MAIEIKSSVEIELLRQANAIVVAVHREIAGAIRPGVSTLDLDRIAARVIALHRGAESAFRGYNGYPAVICASIDEEVVHGIPSARRFLQEGRIIAVDVGVRWRGFIGDAAVTYAVGRIDDAARRLLVATRASLFAGIERARIGNRLSDIGHAVESLVVPLGYSVVTEYVGHGVGRALHEEPQVPNFGRPGLGPRLVAGMTLAIEPMVNEGTSETRVLEDRWTVVTKDGRRSAHFEHSVAVTDDGPLILSDGLPDGLGG